jgi:dinuclear metal center YbgI/SA1388 family protein
MTQSTPLSAIVDYLNTELEVARYQDYGHNGLQIESQAKDVTKVAFAVDAGLSVINAAIADGAQLLIVHHGVLWGKSEPIVGAWANKLRACLSNGLSLYASHLPLDGHIRLGNAAQIAAKVLNAAEIKPYFEHHGATVGVIAKLPKATPLAQVAALIGSCEGATNPPFTMAFGKQEISSVAIATGSATSLIPAAVASGVDLFITGEPKQESYHVAKELGCSVICMGHYASETFGVKALQSVLQERFSVKTVWISEPTGI